MAKREEMKFQTDLSMFQVKITIILAVGIALTSFSISASFGILQQLVVLDSKTTPGHVYQGLQALENYATFLGAVGFGLYILSLVYYLLKRKSFYKRSEHFE